MKPKPMVEIGGKPMLWHIMKIYAAHGVDEFVICLGYKGYLIKEFFANYYLHTSDVTFDLAGGDMEVHRSLTEPWKVTLVDTGEATMTGGRLKRVPPLRRRRRLLLHLRRRARRHRHHRAARLPPRPGPRGDDHRRPAARALRRARRPGRPRPPLRGEAARRRDRDQRRLLRPQPERRPLSRRRLDGLGAGAGPRPGRRRRARLLPPRRLLAADGHAARPHHARRTVGLGLAALAGLELAAMDPAFWRGAPRLPDRPHRLQGRLALALAAGARRRADRLLRRRPDLALALRAGRRRRRGWSDVQRRRARPRRGRRRARRAASPRSSSTWRRSRWCAAPSPNRAPLTRPT